MRVVYGAWSATGTAVDLRKRGIAAETALRAVRGDGAVGTAGDGRAGGPTLRVACPDPGPVHEALGVVAPGRSVDTRDALAAVARERGLVPPQADRIARLERELAAVSVDDADDRRAARRRVAEAGAREAELSERVAALRGALRERRALDEPTAELEAELREAVRELTDVETERIAAEESLAAARRAARADRDARERRLALEDDLGNARRAARAWLVERVADGFVEALAAVPGEARPGGTPGTAAGDDVAAALAVVRVADVDAPVVLSCDRFDSAGAAAATLDAPVLTV